MALALAARQLPCRLSLGGSSSGALPAVTLAAGWNRVQGASKASTRLAAGRDAGWAAPPPRDLTWDDDAGSSGDESDLDLFPEEAGRDPEFVVENLLALVLLVLVALSCGNILLKLVVVAYSLISAAVRYTVIGVLLAMALTWVQPGRWWF